MIACTARVAPEKAVFRPALPLHHPPEFTGEHMAAMTYKEQLLHPNWQRKRLDILQRDDFTCKSCGDKESTLHVHHKQYVKGRLAWEYPSEELVTLCEECHEAMDEQNGQFRELVARLDVQGPRSIAATLALVAGWASSHHQGFAVSNSAPWGDEPGAFIVGEVAAELDAKASMASLDRLLDALRQTPRWVVSSVLAHAAEQMLARMGEPRPPSPFDQFE